MSLTPSIEASGYGLVGGSRATGGPLRITYFTPDGRIIKAIPALRQFAKLDKEGKVIETGTRDANLDKGWLLEKPKKKQLFCRGCDRWHKTAKEVTDCVLKSQKFVDMMAKKVQQEEEDENATLKNKVAELEAKLNKLLEGKS